MADSRSQAPRSVEQVTDALIERIAEGRWGKAIPLPALDQLAAELHTSSEALHGALERLHSEKYISRRKDGTYIVTDVQAQALTVRFSNLFSMDGTRITGEAVDASMEAGAATPTEADRLDIPAGAPVCRVRRMRHHEGQRFMVEVATLPLSVFPGLMESDRVPFRTPVLCKRYGHSVRRAEEHVSLGVASADVAVALGVAYGTPLFVLDRVLFSTDGTPLESRVAYTLMTNIKYVAVWGPTQALE